MTTDTPAVERTYPPKIVTWLGNPLLTRLLRRPGSRTGRGLMLLRVRGRRTGTPIETPVARQEIGGELSCLTSSGWRHNFQGGRECELVLDGRVRKARGVLVADAESVVRAYREVMDRVGPGGYRRTGLKVNVDRPPSDAELTEAVRRYGLAYVRFTLLD
ncbi:MAG: nitroreductase family deazaflavin-dependent oxidoreductase [Pseudonocardia sp.]|nr:nitroreductase family deazaflavin-dependent oxidoreductase [Pseudonocardia sp.]